MSPSWPVIAGEYVVGDPDAPVSVCTLTSEKMVEPMAQVAGVAIAGQVFTANLGIERIVTNVTANPSIRFLLLCGKDSKIFRSGQSLAALADNGVDTQGRIVGAAGYEPVLPELSTPLIEQFREQIELVDRIGDDDIEALRNDIAELVARAPGPFTGDGQTLAMQAAETRAPERFVSIRPGGQKEPLQYDPKGYFVITLDREEEQIVLRHYMPDHTPAHEMRGRVATSMVLGLLREGLVSQLSHAGYLGEELSKAEAALRLGLRYTQDRPLKRMEPPPQAVPPADRPAAAPRTTPRITPPLTRKQLTATADGAEVNITPEITEQSSAHEFGALFLEPSEKDPFSSFTRTDHRISFSTDDQTQTVMGERSDVVVGAIVRVRGPLHHGNQVDGQGVVVLTNVATVQ
jgi:tetrahydromethanopterin S-methyltransferase subunit A